MKLNGSVTGTASLGPLQRPGRGNAKTINCTAGVGLPKPDKESLSVSCGFKF